MSFFHGVTVTNVDIGARTIALPASSVIGLCDVFTPGRRQAPSPTFRCCSPARRTPPRRSASARRSIWPARPSITVPSRDRGGGRGSRGDSRGPGQRRHRWCQRRRRAHRTAGSARRQEPLQCSAASTVAPGHSAQQAVATAMDGLAEKLRAIAILDGPNSTDEAAVAYAKNFGSKRLFMVDPGVQVWDSATNAARNAPASAYAAGLFAWTDAEYGFWSSPSNKEIKGITGTSRPVEFLDGDETCRANLLNNANIATIIRDDGYRLWGNRTLSSDSKWAFVTRVRTMDLVMDAILAGHKWAVDRGITKTCVKDVTEGLRAFMRDLKNQGAVISFEVYADRT